MNNTLYKMMISNLKEHLRNSDPNDQDTLNAFRISEVLAIATGKLKADIILELTQNENN